MSYKTWKNKYEALEQKHAQLIVQLAQKNNPDNDAANARTRKELRRAVRQIHQPHNENPVSFIEYLVITFSLIGVGIFIYAHVQSDINALDGYDAHPDD